MKIFQILNDICHWDATNKFPTLESTIGRFPPDILFVEAPDNVFEGWGYLNGEFIQPTPPDGWLYDKTTGTFYKENDHSKEIKELKNKLTQTDYKIIKYSEYSLANLQAPYDIQQLHEERQALRDKINELETLQNS